MRIRSRKRDFKNNFVPNPTYVKLKSNIERESPRIQYAANKVRAVRFHHHSFIAMMKEERATCGSTLEVSTITLINHGPPNHPFNTIR